MGIGRLWNSVCTKFWINWWGTNVNDVKSQFLHSAIYYKDMNLIDALVDKGIDVNLLNNYGKSALHEAVRYGYQDMVNYILDRNADANIPDSSGYTPLYYALHRNEGPIAEDLLSKGALFNPSFKGHATLLHNAAYSGYVGAINIMLKNGANANYFDDVGCVPAHYAIFNLDSESFKLLAPKTDLGIINPITGKTLLHTAAAKGFKAVVEALIEAKVDLSYVALDGHSPIGEAVINGYIKIANAIADAGGVFHREVEGSELINKASANGHTKSISLLLDYGVDINAYDSQGNIPIYYAKTNAMIDFLCHNGAIVDFKDILGYTSLHKAARIGDIEKVKILLKHGANADTTSYDRSDHSGYTIEGSTALNDALIIGHSGVVASALFYSIDSSQKRAELIMKSKIMGNEIILNAAKNGYNDVIDFYYDIRNYSKPDLTDTMYHAYSNNKLVTAHKLKNLGATLDVRVQKNIELLHNAVKNGWYETVEDLLKLGIHPDTWDCSYEYSGLTSNHTSLYYAIEVGDLKMVNLLLQYGANPNVLDPASQQHSIYHAILKGNIEIFKALAQKGASTNEVDLTTGQTPLILAIKLASQTGGFFSSPDKYTYIAEWLAINSKLPHIATYPSLNSYQQATVISLNKADPATGKTAVQLALSLGKIHVAEELLGNKFVLVDLKSAFIDIMKIGGSVGKVMLTKALFNHNWGPGTTIDVNGKHFDGGQTFMHKAAEFGCVEVIEHLKSIGADLSIKDDKGELAVDVAISKGYQDDFLAKLMPAEAHQPTFNTPTHTPGTEPTYEPSNTDHAIPSLHTQEGCTHHADY